MRHSRSLVHNPEIAAGDYTATTGYGGRTAWARERLHAIVDIAKLSIPVRMIPPLFQFAITLQAIVLRMQELANFDLAERMPLVTEFGSESPCAFAYPSQRRLRITTGSAVNQTLQRCQQRGIGLRQVLASRARTTDTPRRQGLSSRNLTSPLADGLPREANKHGVSGKPHHNPVPPPRWPPGCAGCAHQGAAKCV
jgi:hypothetical protein